MGILLDIANSAAIKAQTKSEQEGKSWLETLKKELKYKIIKIKIDNTTKEVRIRELTDKEKVFLIDEGLDPNIFKLIRMTKDDYIFLNIETNKEWEFRR